MPDPNVWLMGTVPGREYPMLVRLKTDGAEPCWETRTGDTTPLRACSHWSYFEPAPEEHEHDTASVINSDPPSVVLLRYLVDSGLINEEKARELLNFPCWIGYEP